MNHPPTKILPIAPLPLPWVINNCLLRSCIGQALGSCRGDTGYCGVYSLVVGGLQDRTQRESSCQALHDTALGSQGLLMCPHCPTSNVPSLSLLSLTSWQLSPEPPPLRVASLCWAHRSPPGFSFQKSWFPGGQFHTVLLPCSFAPILALTMLSCHRLFSMRHLSFVKIVDSDCLVHICIPRAEHLASRQMFVEENHWINWPASCFVCTKG